jgi:hypothetical protein
MIDRDGLIHPSGPKWKKVRSQATTPYFWKPTLFHTGRDLSFIVNFVSTLTMCCTKVAHWKYAMGRFDSSCESLTWKDSLSEVLINHKQRLFIVLYFWQTQKEWIIEPFRNHGNYNHNTRLQHANDIEWDKGEVSLGLYKSWEVPLSC